MRTVSNQPYYEAKSSGDNPEGFFARPVARFLDFYLNGHITDSKDYIQWNQEIRQAGENDLITIHINCYGGDIMTTIQLIRAMSDTKATVVASVEGACMSAATFVFLAANVCEVSEHSQFMIHNYSSGSWGKGNELIAKAIATDNWANNLMRKTYEHFLTSKEIEDVIAGKDIWMEQKEVIQRLEKRNKKMKRKPPVASVTN